MTSATTRTSSPVGDSAVGRTLMLLLGLAVTPYLNALHNELVYDDHAVVTENRLVRSLHPRLMLQPSLDGYTVEWYRPLTMYSFALNYRLGRLNPLGYHVANILLHATNVWLLYGIALRVLRGRCAALAAAGLFAVHAIHVEAVTPVSGRADLLATVFVLITWRLALSTDRPAACGRVAAIAAAALAGLLAKESAIVVWPLLVLGDFAGLGWAEAQERKPLERLASRARVHAALAVALGVYLGLRFAVTGGFVAASDVAFRTIENPLATVGLGVRLVTAGWVFLKYCGLLLAPVALSADYSYNQIPVVDSWHDLRLLAVVAATAGLACGIAALWRRDRLIAASLLLFILLWLPISNMVLVIGTIMGERLMYLPSVGFTLLVGALVARMNRDNRRLGVMLTALAAAVAATHVGLAFERNRDWRSQETLYRDTVEQSPHSAKAHFNYGIVLQGHNRPDAAAEHYRAALRIAPYYPEAHNALGTVLLARQDLRAAEECFRAAVQADPRLAKAWTNFGTVLFRSGRDKEARQALEQAVRLNPTLALAHATLGAIAERNGEAIDALEHYGEAYRLSPMFEGLAPHLAQLLEKAGRADDARTILRNIERVRPQ